MANFNINYLVVAGGGGGGSYGGGGAGGMLTGTLSSVAIGTVLSIDVGAGGAGGGTGATNSGYFNEGVNGLNSSISGTGITTVTSTGGGRGGDNEGSTASGRAGSGGSGGGGSDGNGGALVPNADGGSGTPGQGNSGGNGYHNDSAPAPYQYFGGSGGGAGAAGGSASSSGATAGGNGLPSSITGTQITYAGGGGGVMYNRSTAVSGGTGGGGNGGVWNSSATSMSQSTAGTDGLGGGGGAGKKGGDGIVILRYATADANYTTTGITPTETTDGTDTILSFTTVGTGTITFTTPPPPPFSGTKVTTPVTDFDKPFTEEGLKIPSGTSLNQPTGVTGMVRNDTTQSSKGSSSAITHYNGTNWRYFENELNTSFNTVTYTGSTSPHAITGIGFQPDLIWIKNRVQADSYAIVDSVRGIISPAPYIASNLADVENTSTNMPTSVQSDGFTITGNGGRTNTSGEDYVAWCFKAPAANNSADFNGSNSRINLPQTSPFIGSNDIKSISAWVKADTTSSRVFPFSVSSSTNSNDYFYIGYMGDLNAIYVATRNGSSSNSSTRSAATTTDTEWHHIVACLTSTGVDIYLDGVALTVSYSLSGTGTNTSWISYPSYSPTVASNIGILRQASLQSSNGQIQQVRMFNTALSSSQVTELYNETKADNSVLNYPSGAGCIAAYPLGENANDLSGSYNATASNVAFGLPGYLTQNTEGTTTSTVSANNDLGFSIAKYRGNGSSATVGHGLGQKPELMIFKRTNAAAGWLVSDGTSMGYLNLTDTFTTTRHNQYINSVNANTIGLNNVAGINGSGDEMIAYCFVSKPNYSKVGTYLGNGNAAGPIVTLGFEPAFVMIKGVDQTSNWTMLDNKRDTSNPNSARLDADSSMAEYSAVGLMDFNSDGFQIVTTQGGQNASGKTFIYLAFANTI